MCLISKITIAIKAKYIEYCISVLTTPLAAEEVYWLMVLTENASNER